ncbi:MAG TPA: NADH-quinone oxidoreductase subunit L [Nitriliruptorales bacterium]
MNSLLLAAEGGGHQAATSVLEATGAVGAAWLIAALPLLGFAILILAGRRFGEPAAGWIANLFSWAAFALSVAVLLQLIGQPAAERRYVVDLFEFIAVGGLDVSWAILVDPLTATMLLVVTGVGSLVHLYSLGYMHGDQGFARYFAYLNLFLFSMLVLVLGSSLLTLFVGWELVGLSSYLLIGFWFEQREYATAAKKAFITNRVGDVSFMVGMFLVFATFGTLDFFTTDGHGILQDPGSVLEGDGATALAIGLLLLGGAVAKSAQIPLYVWLPDAMAGPTPVSALIHAATMVTAGVYLIARTGSIYVLSLDAMTVVAWIGAATAVVAALIAIRQDDIKKILAYSTVSQLGYMFVGVGVGAFSEGMFHLVTHAFFKGLLFLAAGSVMHALANATDVWRMGGLRHHMPVTYATSAVAWLAISGVPPFAGFFSKDQILTTAYEHGFTAIWIVGVLVAVLTAFYMSRWFFLVFLGEERFDPKTVEPHESPATMTVPLLVLGVLSATGGAALNFTHHGQFFLWLEPYVADASFLEVEGLALGEPALIGISVAAAAVGIVAAAALYLPRIRYADFQRDPIRGPLAELMERKFFVDELYGAIFVKAGGALSSGLAWFDRRVIDGAVNGAGVATTVAASYVRRLQTGYLRSYVAGVVVGAVALMAAFLVQVR